MPTKILTVLGLTVVTMTLALAPTGWARGDRDGAAREARQLARLDRITTHQIQVEARHDQAKPKASHPTPPPAVTQTPAVKSGK